MQLDAQGGMNIGMGTKPTSKAPPLLDDARLRQQAIGAKLRPIFDEVVNEPIPDEFLEILRREDKSETGEA
jgi:hypothetical protein